MDKTTQNITVKLRDRVTFDTDEGIQAGYVNDLRRDLGNGELHAWVELEHHLPGCFRAVRVSDILTSDQVGPPSTCYIGFDWATHAACLNTPLVIDDTADLLERAKRALLIHGFTDCGGEEWMPPTAYRPIEIFDMVKLEDAHQSGLDDARRGVHELLANEEHPLDGVDGDKPFCRFHFYSDSGDSSVGEPGRAYWALSADQSGTELAQILVANTAASKDETSQDLARAENALLSAGFTDCGGQEWKPPIGKPPRFNDAISTTPPGWIDDVITQLIKLIENAEDLDICHLLAACSLLNAWSSEQYAQSIGFFPHLPSIENDDKKQIKLVRMEIAKSNAAAYLARYLPKDIDGDSNDGDHRVTFVIQSPVTTKDLEKV
jgi:hypothetical protein